MTYSMTDTYMETETANKVGLVLTGGGAKGAYHVGAIKALAELNIPVHAVAGASIGALNGAVVATASNLQLAHENLLGIWEALGSDKVIALSKNAPAYLAMLGGMGVAFRAMPVLASGAMVVNRIIELAGLELPDLDGQILDDTCLVKLLEECTSPESIHSGLPLYVSVYETEGGVADILGVLKATLRLGNTRESEYLHLQDLPDSEIQEALLASAALPLLFRSRNISGKKYTDGGQGDWYGVGGNTPVKPLVDAGCNTIIVVHLCDGSAWDRSQYPDVNIIEIRPNESIARGNALADVLGFDHQRIGSWIDQGYQDSIYVLKRILDTVNIYNNMDASRVNLNHALEHSAHADEALNKAMKRIS
ncbi:MAG: phospholipase [Thalassobium sp.]|nr:MAG: phospholipase [Thalassobium sp.]PHQ88301.1 MAG: phospholipase [Thalassobium sp.]